MKRKVAKDNKGAIPAKKPDIKITNKDERDKFHQSLYRPPTRDEINELKETETLYKDSLFRMQMKCLLDEVKLKDSDHTELDEVLHSLHKFLESLEDWQDSKSMSDLSWIPPDVQYPIPGKKDHSKGSFKFKKPSSIKVIGSFLLKTGASPRPSVDVSVEIPSDCFHKKDYLNYRYHTKRALYMVVLASKLLSWDEAVHVYFSRTRRNTKKPVLVLECKCASGKKLEIQILPVIPNDLFQYSRFAPHQNNVRMSWITGQGGQEDTGPPTPHYNTSILADMLHEQHLHHLYNSLKVCPGMTDAIILCKVWLYQRGFYEDCCTFNGFVASMLMAHLLSEHKITRHMSSYQILRVTLQFIATTDWTETGVSMATDCNDKTPSLEEMSAVYKVVFVDPSGYLNLCAELTVADYKHLIYEAAQAIQILDMKHIDNFDCLFVKHVSFAEKFDHWFRLPRLSDVSEAEKYSRKFADVPDASEWQSCFTNELVALLEKGLGSRISLIYAKTQMPNKWLVSEVPQGSAMDDVLFGLILNPGDYDRILEKGPAADSPEASEFSTFWGSKTELRRFKDGSISGAVVWNVKSLADRMVVTSQVVTYLINKYFGVSTEKVTYCCNQLNLLLQPRIQESKTKSVTVNGTNYEEQQRVCEVFEELSKEIRKLNDLPLQVNSVQGTSPVFRLTDVFAPRLCLKKKKKPVRIMETQTGSYEKPDPTGKLNMWTPVMEVALQFETSGRWPNDLGVVQHLKAALYIKLGNLLNNQYDIKSVVSQTFLDIFKGGYVFRLRIFHYRELNLLKEIHASTPEKKELAQKAKELEKDMVKRPLHSTMINGLSHQFPGFRDAVRLAKRWVSAHLLGKHLSEEAVEVIMASVFVTPAPCRPPISYQSGFLRFLDCLASFDWKHLALVVDLNSSLTEDDYERISEHFNQNRTSLPSLFIATSYDQTDSIWTTQQPDAQILRRLTFLANESKKKLEKSLLSLDFSNLKDIFRPHLGDFDCVILLDRDHLPRHYQAVDTAFLVKPPTLQGITSDVIPVANFDPAQLYLDEMRSSFSDFADFFYDNYGGTAIAVMWKSKQFVPQPLKVFHSHYRRILSQPEGNQVLTVPDMLSILADFRLLGKGIVKDIKMVRTPNIEGECH